MTTNLPIRRLLLLAAAAAVLVTVVAAPAWAGTAEPGDAPDPSTPVDAPDDTTDAPSGEDDPCQGPLCDEQPVEVEPPVLRVTPEVLGQDECQGPLCDEQPVEVEPPVLRLDTEADAAGERQIRLTG
jgi:hypothetical protein